ncbi:MAG: GNAT family N-acetyltransferase [Bellilinea sp.]
MPIQIHWEAALTEENLSAIHLHPDLHAALLDMAQDFHAQGDNRFNLLLRGSNEIFFAFLRDLAADAQEDDLPPGMVPQSTLWLLKDGSRLLGFSRLRRRMESNLEEKGGQISVEIRPSERGKGYESELLRLTLKQAAALGMSEIILTCAEEDHEQRVMIEASGGELVETRRLARSERSLRVYRLPCKA